MSTYSQDASRNAGGSFKKEHFQEIFPFFRSAPHSLVETILSFSRKKTLPGNMLVKLEGDPCHDFILMLSGEKRIFKIGGSAREITLYEIGPGEICVLNASCILANTRLPANAATLCETDVLLLPAEHFLDMMARYAEMRAFIHSHINTSLASIMALLSEITFGKMDERLNSYLLEKSENGTLRRTHQQIANDLGTSREVVSRLLKDLERRGLASLSRNCIELEKP
jgi:CRP/FNR family transcriptional regulator